MSQFETNGLKALYFQGVETERFLQHGGQPVVNLHRLTSARRVSEVRAVEQTPSASEERACEVEVEGIIVAPPQAHRDVGVAQATQKQQGVKN